MEVSNKRKKSNVSRVLIVIVNYNGREILERNLRSVTLTDYPNFDVAIVDNNSSDGSVEYIKKNFPNIKVIELQKNLGFGKANNVAFDKFPEYELYALINNDMRVEKDWLSSLVKTIQEDKRIAAVGPKVLYSKKKDGKFVINTAGMIIDKYYRGYDRYDGEVDSGKFNLVEEVDAVSGGAVLLRGDAIKEIGGFNKRVFFYYEDVDLSIRLRDAGYKLMYNGSSVVYHEHMATSRKWSSFVTTALSNINRGICITMRKNVILAFGEMVRSLLEWFWIRLTKGNYRKWLERNLEKNRLYEDYK